MDDDQRQREEQERRRQDEEQERRREQDQAAVSPDIIKEDANQPGNLAEQFRDDVRDEEEQQERRRRDDDDAAARQKAQAIDLQNQQTRDEEEQQERRRRDDDDAVARQEAQAIDLQNQQIRDEEEQQERRRRDDDDAAARQKAQNQQTRDEEEQQERRRRDDDDAAARQKAQAIDLQNQQQWQEHLGAIARDRQDFMQKALAQILADPDHQLRKLVDPQTNDWWARSHLSELPGVQAGHLTSRHSGAPERFALEDPFYNQISNWKGETQGAIFNKPAVDIGGVPVERRTAEEWRCQGLIT